MRARWEHLTAVTLAATGGIAPYTWTIASGALPACLTLNNGTITGTPTAACAGSYSVSFLVTHSGTPTAPTATTATLNLVINAAPAIAFTGAMRATATYKLAYAGSAAATGGAGTLSYSATGLPAWLSLNPSTGAVTGTPTAVGAYNFSVTASDAFGDSGNQPYTITVSYPAMAVTAATLPTGYVSPAYPSTTLAATGGSEVSANYAWALANGQHCRWD